jgi:hypothetical protein
MAATSAVRERCMRLRYVSLVVALVTLACGGKRAASIPAAPAADRTPVDAAVHAPAATGTLLPEPTDSATTPAPVKAAAVLATPAMGATLSLAAAMTVSLAGTGGSYTYTYESSGVAIALEGDGTFDSTAPATVSLALSAGGCTWTLQLVNPQIEIAGSLSDDRATLRIASIRVSQDDVTGSGGCSPDAGQSPHDLGGIGAGTINLSPATPLALPFSDGAAASLPQPAAIERYPRSVSVQWSGTVQLALPGN